MGVFTQEMNRLRRHMDELNHQLFNPVGLNILWPRKVGFLFVSYINDILAITFDKSIIPAGDRVLCELSPGCLECFFLTAFSIFQ
jgi:hypothetical protein